MAISRLQAALASATNDVTIAAANLNFDFSVVKCEAPKEYHNVGDLLCQNKKEAAEFGTAHMTAKKLGALFDGLCPPTPKLLRAYGLRASEIAATTTEMEKPAQGIFKEHAGVDGTFIWASATSSTTALQVHLLACMLARIWRPSHATSIWHELVKERTLDIARRYEKGDEMPFALVAAATHSEIPRDWLANWDASARAWLQVADRAQNRRQTKLRLIIDNIDITVNEDNIVLSSVIDAWRSALVCIENMLGGMPQAIETGPALLALSSWHLYPSILLLHPKVKEAEFDDPLIPSGGSFTLGLTMNKDGAKGIHWSLSLKHLRYYGRATHCEASLNQTTSKITFEQFCLAVFGAVAGKWGFRSSELSVPAKFFVEIQRVLEKIATDESKGRSGRSKSQKVTHFLQDSSHWWHLMVRAASMYLEQEDDTIRKLVLLGLRRAAQFIPDSHSGSERAVTRKSTRDREKSRPQDYSEALFFGLTSSQFIVYGLKDLETRLAFLKSSAEHIIRDPPGHGLDPLNMDAIIRYVEDDDLDEQRVRHIPLVDTQFPLPVATNEVWSHGTVFQIEMQPYHCDRKETSQDSCLSQGQECTANPPSTDLGVSREFTVRFGDPATAAILVEENTLMDGLRLPTLDTLIHLLEEELFNVDELLDHISLRLNGPLGNTLKALSVASTIFRVLPNATVSPDILSHPLGNTHWAVQVQSLSANLETILDAASRTFATGIGISRQLSFSCVAYMCSCVDIDPGALIKVFAMAHEDSLYIATQVTCDPSKGVQGYELHRVLGNVGRSGITLLVPPEAPIMRHLDRSSWSVIANNAFNDLDEDHFSRSSLHLSFTDLYIPLYRPSDHSRDHGVNFLESVVSLHDSGAWVGDVDILKAFEDSRVQWLSNHPSCSTYAHEAIHRRKLSMISAENWDEIVDHPSEDFVVRSHGNWMGRLAAMAVLSQTLPKTDMIFVCSESFCWRCWRHWECWDPQESPDSAPQPQPARTRRAFIY